MDLEIQILSWDRHKNNARGITHNAIQLRTILIGLIVFLISTAQGENYFIFLTTQMRHEEIYFV